MTPTAKLDRRRLFGLALSPLFAPLAGAFPSVPAQKLEQQIIEPEAPFGQYIYGIDPATVASMDCVVKMLRHDDGRLTILSVDHTPSLEA